MSKDVLREPISTISFCWVVERRDGAGFGLTGHDQVVEADGVRCIPASGLEPSAVTKGEAGEPVAECGGALTSAALTEADLLSGRWDRARTRLLAVDWSNPSSSPICLSEGELGHVSTSGHSFSAELLGCATLLQRPVSPVTSPECRAELGDRRCRIDLAGRRKRIAVRSCDGSVLTLVSELEVAFRFGSGRWMSGANTGLSSHVMAVDGHKVTLREVPSFPVRSGDTLLFTEGCDKRLDTCAERFGNAVNFRGEPHLPGNDLLTRYPGN